MPKRDNTPQDEKAVADALDGAGQQIMALFRKNAQDLRALTDNYTALSETSAAKESANTAFLTKLYNEIGESLGLHTPIAIALNNGEQVSPAAVEEALAATEVAKQSELEWKTMVDQTLADLDERTTSNTKRIDVLEEGRDKVPTLASVPAAEPTSAPTPEVKQPEEKAPAAVVTEQQPSDRTATSVHYINPRTWGGMAWILAAAGMIVGYIVVLNIYEGFFPGVPAPIQWVRWVTLWLFPVFGLFAGGALGSSIEERQLASKTTTVV